MTDPESVPAESDGAHTKPSAATQIARVVERERKTVARTRTFAILGIGFTAVVLGLAWASGGTSGGYVPTVVGLLTPLELLVPILAMAFGYRAITGDADRGELDVLQTYPISAHQHVLGVYIGRAIGLLAVILASLALVAIAVVFLRTEPIGWYASHASTDSPILFARFAVLTALFAVAILAVAIAISAVAREARTVLALAVATLVVVLVGLDLALVYGLASGVIGEGSLIHAIAFSPLSAYRGLVFESVVVTAAGTGPQTAAPLSSVVGLLTWTIGSLAVATLAVRR